MSRPSNKLIEAWQQFLHTRREAQVARMKSIGMFKVSANDIELYNRANELHMRANTLDLHADAQFRKALAAEYGSRYRIEWISPTDCTVWVRDKYVLLETAVQFSRGLKKK